MRLKIPFIVAFALFALLLVLVAKPATATIPIVAGDLEKVADALGLERTAQISETVTPTSTGSTTFLPTPTVTATVVSSPSLTPTPIMTVGQSMNLYLPAVVEASSGSPGGQSDPCGPNSLFSSPLAIEPTSTPAPTPTAISQTTDITETAYVDGSTVCPPNAHELALADLIINSPLQQRTVMTYSPVLAQVAKNHAMDMATRDFFGPTDPDGIGPNRRAELAGYLLPEYYGQTLNANNIETTMAGYASAEDVWQVFVNSNGSDHVWGRNTGYVDQTEYGIGYAYVAESERERYWVILIAKPRE